MEALRDRILHGCGTEEPWFLDEDALAAMGQRTIAAHWRKPLRIDEVNLMAPTPEVRARPGRP